MSTRPPRSASDMPRDGGPGRRFSTLWAAGALPRHRRTHRARRFGRRGGVGRGGGGVNWCVCACVRVCARSSGRLARRHRSVDPSFVAPSPVCLSEAGREGGVAHLIAATAELEIARAHPPNHSHHRADGLQYRDAAGPPPDATLLSCSATAAAAAPHPHPHPQISPSCRSRPTHRRAAHCPSPHPRPHPHTPISPLPAALPPPSRARLRGH
jgi:hypothetical protein